MMLPLWVDAPDHQQTDRPTNGAALLQKTFENLHKAHLRGTKNANKGTRMTTSISSKSPSAWHEKCQQNAKMTSSFFRSAASLYRQFATLWLVSVSACVSSLAADYRSNILDPTYRHDRWETQPKDIVREFRAFMVSFDGLDDNDGDGTGDTWGQPEFVAYEVRKVVSPLGKGPARPSAWIHDAALASKGICPKDNTYRNSGYDRGHMCQKYIAFRLGPDADWNTHTTLNACPQVHQFNDGIWGDLEECTQDWANKYGTIWVVCGPIFKDRKPTKFIGDRGEMKIGVPDAFFKLVVRESQGRPEVLAFRYPHQEIARTAAGYEHHDYLVSVDVIERETGLDFLTALPDDQEQSLERSRATTLWPRK
jgi:endonuclease G, mitochondrial